MIFLKRRKKNWIYPSRLFSRIVNQDALIIKYLAIVYGLIFCTNNFFRQKDIISMYVHQTYLVYLDWIYFKKPRLLKFGFSEKATKFEKNLRRVLCAQQRTLKSGINVPLRLLIFWLFSMGYGLIPDFIEPI